MDLTDICRVFHLAAAQYTFLPAFHGTLDKTDHILGQKANLNKYKKIETTLCILSDHNGLNLEFNNNNKKNNRKY
jgi:endonuclease/exonuclease/phosphatase family metal-dependent hydrolase